MRLYILFVKLRVFSCNYRFIRLLREILYEIKVMPDYVCMTCLMRMKNKFIKSTTFTHILNLYHLRIISAKAFNISLNTLASLIMMMIWCEVKIGEALEINSFTFYFQILNHQRWKLHSEF